MYVQLYSKIAFHSKTLPMKSARWKDGAQNLGNVRTNQKRMSVVESHTVIALHRYFISYVGVLPE